MSLSTPAMALLGGNPGAEGTQNRASRDAVTNKYEEH